MKRAQQSYISLLIFVIGLSLIIYILMLPPADRQELLEQNTTRPAGVKDKVIILLTEEPGTLTNVAEDRIVHDFSPFDLSSRTDTKILASYDSVYIKKSLFEESDRSITFSITDFDNTDDIALSFNIDRGSGILTILLNDKILTSAEYDSQSPPPLRLPKDWLQSTNTITFQVSGPGIEFWKNNEYLITNVKVTADVTDTSGREAKQIFVLSNKEIEAVKQFQLGFIAECNEGEVSPLQIYLNKRLIYKSTPECGFPTKTAPQEPSRLREGENDILFIVDKGFYQIYSIDAVLELEEPIFPTYYFYLNPDTYALIKGDKADLNITMLFSNTLDRKAGLIVINDYIVDFNTYDLFVSRMIDSYVRQGNNAVEIRPKVDTINILELNVLMAE